MQSRNGAVVVALVLVLVLAAVAVSAEREQSSRQPSIRIHLFCPFFWVLATSVFHLANFPANWYKANLFCRQYGYQLAIVDSAAKQAAIQHEIRSAAVVMDVQWPAARLRQLADGWAGASGGVGGRRMRAHCTASQPAVGGVSVHG